MSRTAIDGLHALLRAPAAASLPASLRASLVQAWEAADADHARRAPWPVIADTLQVLSRLDADASALLAALLFDLPGLRAAVAGELAASHPAVRGLLEGQDAADPVWALHAGREAGRNGEGLRRLLLAIIQDLRVVPILLARQLAKMRVADRLPEAERRALAQLTRDLHAPLANRLGIWQLKWELEDLAFRHLEPDTWRRLARELDESRAARERYIEAVKKQLPLDRLYDLRAVRVMVADVAACYATLGVVHALWAPVPGEFDDYIARPKPNGYASLHTAVVGPEGRTLEVQVRTGEMHEQAELGVAAHWRYKETGGSAAGKGAGRAFERKIAWMRQLLEQAGDGRDEGLAGALDAELVEERVYALTPRGEVVDLPQGATPLDFAYNVHTMVGHRYKGAKVNGRIVPLGHHLRSGDRVEIMTGKEPDPKRDWLLPANGFLASGRSRDKVRAWFHKLDRSRNLQAGRELLERELKRLGLHQAELAPVARRFHAETVDDLYIQVALGDVGPNQVVRVLHELQHAAEPATPAVSRPSPRRAPRKDPAGFTVQGVGNLLVQLARCCQPVPGEPIAGYLTRSRGVTVHRAGCASFARLAAAQPQRVLPVEWGSSGGGYEVDVAITGVDRKWLLKDVTTLVAQEDAHLSDIRSEVGSNGRAQLQLKLRVSDYGQLSTLLGKLDALPGVEQARRLG